MDQDQNTKRLGIKVGILLLLLVAVVAGIILTRTDSTTDETKPVEGRTTPVSPDPAETPEAEPTATYTVRYNVTWSSSSHPETLPPGAHVSPIVVVAHSNENDLFASGTLATDGIEMMAETGATKVLLEEIAGNSSISASAVGTRLDVPDSLELEIELDQEHSLLSAVSMLAPTPDWFIAVNSTELFQDGQWLEEVTLAMRPYDAGTDSETTFTTDDIDTDPVELIGPPVDDAFVNAADEAGFATLTITRQS